MTHRLVPYFREKMKSAFIATAACLFWAGTKALAQTGGGYSLTWSTIDSGGGSSAGGAISISGTIGQPDAGPVLNGGPFSLLGGFWSGFAVSAPRPVLSIRRVGSNVVLSWPYPSTGFVLQQTPNLNGSGAGWTLLTQTPVLVGPNLQVTLPPTGVATFFRLAKTGP
jgi:hypothetical protein